MERWASKVISVAVSLLLPLFFTILPHFVSGFVLKHGREGKRILSYLLCLGGGIFLGTYLLHMAPEVRSILDEYLLTPHHISYPVGDVIVGCGFFFVLFAEKIVTRINKRRTQKKQKQKTDKEQQHSNNRDHSVSVQTLSSYVESQCDENDSNTKRIEEEDSNESSTDSNSINGMDNSVAWNQDGKIEIKPGKTKNGSSISLYCADASDENDKTITDKTEKSKKLNGESTNEKTKEAVTDPETLGEEDEDAFGGHSHGHEHGHGVRSLILMMALSLHHIFEGMSIGLQINLTKVFTLLGAVMSHEVIISFSLGMQLIRCKYSLRRLIITAFVCSLFLPVGVAIGTAMTETIDEKEARRGSVTFDRVQLANGILQAFAAGNFIFVTFFEILQEEIQPHDSGIGKVASACLGFTLLSLVELIPEEEEDNSVYDYNTDEMLQNITTTMALLSSVS